MDGNNSHLVVPPSERGLDGSRVWWMVIILTWLLLFQSALVDDDYSHLVVPPPECGGRGLAIGTAEAGPPIGGLKIAEDSH